MCLAGVRGQSRCSRCHPRSAASRVVRGPSASEACNVPLQSRLYQVTGQSEPKPPPLPTVLHLRRVLRPLARPLPIEANHADDLLGALGFDRHKSKAVYPIYVCEVPCFPVAKLRLGGEEAQVDRTLAQAVVEALEG